MVCSFGRERANSMCGSEAVGGMPVWSQPCSLEVMPGKEPTVVRLVDSVATVGLCRRGAASAPAREGGT